MSALPAVEFYWCLRVFANFVQHSVYGQDSAGGTVSNFVATTRPGVGQDDQLYLPSAPGTLKSGTSSPKLDLNTDIFTECPWESTGMRINIGFWGSTMLHVNLLI